MVLLIFSTEDTRNPANPALPSAPRRADARAVGREGETSISNPALPAQPNAQRKAVGREDATANAYLRNTYVAYQRFVVTKFVLLCNTLKLGVVFAISNAND